MTTFLRALTLAAALLSLTMTQGSAAKAVEYDQATIADLSAAMTAGTLTSEKLVQLCLARIDAFDRKGPSLHAVLTLNPKALDTARALDAERKAKGPRSALHGIPIVLKDKSSEAAKSLKCGECGAMNYPTEWYCERCGAELASL